MPKTYEWDKLTRASKLASVAWPHLTSEAIRKDMTAIASGEGKKAPAPSPLLKDSERQFVSPLGGQAKR
jgi:hypothetical protein